MTAIQPLLKNCGFTINLRIFKPQFFAMTFFAVQSHRLLNHFVSYIALLFSFHFNSSYLPGGLSAVNVKQVNTLITSLYDLSANRMSENLIKGMIFYFRVLENSNALATTMIGTPYYMSPELFSNKPYDYKAICVFYYRLFDAFILVKLSSSHF